ncbi:MAG: polymerase [Paenibacillus sp.]|nr:polymerase [Paenibacillus sp.]
MQPIDRQPHLDKGRGGSGLDVVGQLKRQDEKALQALMDQYGDYLLRTACLLLKDRQAAEEAVQDAFVTAYYKIGQLQDPLKLKSWLTRIVVNRCRMRQRTRDWKRLFSFARMEPFLEDVSEPGPEQSLMLELRNERLSDAVRQLAYPYREAITLYYFNEMNIEEMSEQLECNRNTIKARLSRGRAQLKRMLEEGADHDGQR